MKTFLLLLFFIFFLSAHAQEKIFLYPSTEKVTIDGFDRDKEPPYMDHYKAHPDTAHGGAILICPGGAYTNLALQHEGKDVARFFNNQGFDAFVLHYRLNNFEQQGHRFPAPYRDVTTALRIIKSKAKDLHLDGERIGILGFSAGGHLASMASTMFLPAHKKSKDPLEKFNSRPAFSILIYPVITLAGAAAHAYSREMLLGKNPDPTLVDSLSTQNRITAHTPPTFLVYANDDKAVPPENGILYYEALRKFNINVNLHIYDRGGHGFGLGPKDPVLKTWPTLSIEWLKKLGFMIKTNHETK